MTPQIDLQRIERRTFRETAIDGLLELMIGIWFFYISGALNGNTRTFAFMPIAFFVCFKAVLFFKNRFVYPRLGYANLSLEKNQFNGRIILIFLAAAFMVLVAILIITGDLAHPARWYNRMPIFISLFLAGAFFAMAQFTGLARFHVYTAVTILSAIPFMIIPFKGKLEAIGMHLLALSGFFIIAGLFFFIYFLRKYPVLSEVMIDEQK